MKSEVLEVKPGPIGIHLGEDRIKIAQVASDAGKFEIVEMISIATPKGGIVGGYIKTPRIVAEEIGNAVNSVKFQGRKAIIAIPSEILKISIATVPETQNLDNAISSRIAQMAFEHPEEMSFDYKIIGKGKGTVSTVVAITNKTHVQSIKELVNQAKLIFIGSDLEMLSIYRLCSKIYRTDRKPAIIALFSGSCMKLSMFLDTVFVSVKTTELETPRAMLDPKLAGIEINRFFEEYRKFHLVTEIPSIFLAGLPDASFTIEKAVWETTGMQTTSIRWSQIFSVSQSYTNFPELKNRFGAYACAIGLSIADSKIPTDVPSPIIADPRQDGLKPEYLNFFASED